MVLLINNNNNNNKEEASSGRDELKILFWKVIHNKFIFKKIFQIINTAEWVKYKKVFHINPGRSRIKFKNIHSMEWMIVNKEYQLLKCKLQHCEKLTRINATDAHTGDNYIEVTENGMYTLLRLGGCPFDQEQQLDQQQLLNDALILSDILPSILDNKKLEIANMNLVLMAMKNTNLTALKILLNEPYSLPIYPSDLEWVIQYSSPSILSEIINLPPPSNLIISPSTKSKSIKLAFKNQKHRDEMLKFILDNPQLYNSPESSSSSLDYSETRKKFKSKDGPPITNSVQENKKLGILSLFKIKSLEIQNRLLDLGCFTFDYGPENGDIALSFIMMDTISSICLGIGIGIGSGVDRVKEIHKILSKISNGYYRSYLSHYDEPINGLDLMLLIEHCLSTFSTKSLSYLLSNEYFIGYLEIHKYKIELFTNDQDNSKIEVASPPPPSIEFIKLYLSNISIISNYQCSKTIDQYIFNIGSNSGYEIILNEIGQCCLNRYPAKWNSILSVGGNKIQEFKVTKETIDYLAEFKSCLVIQQIISDLNKGMYKLESSTLVRYALDSHDQVLYSNGNIFSCAIENCEIQCLYQISNSSINEQRNFKMYEPYLKVETIVSQPIENIINLLIFFESINFDCFYIDTFTELIESLSISTSFIGGGSSGSNLNEINQLSVLFNRYTNKSIELLVLSMVDCLPSKMQLILNNFNPISTSPIFNISWNAHLLLHTPMYNDNGEILFYPNERVTLFQQCIEIILHHLNLEISQSKISNDNETTSGAVVNIEMYSTIVNYFFKCLISTEYVELACIYNVLNLINTTNDNIKALAQQIIIIESSFYNSFYYICLKSMKFQKYIMKLPFIYSVINDEFDGDGDGEYLSNVDYESNGYDIAKYLDPSIFTFEYLFGTGINGNCGASFDQVLEKLVYHLSRLPATKDKQLVIENSNYYTASLNSDLTYFLKINRIDLFFKLLDEIQKQLNDTTFKIGNFPTVIEEINNEQIIYNGCEFELYQQTITDGRIFKFKPLLFNQACRTFENSEWEFQKFISFCNYYSVVDCLCNTDFLVVNSFYLNHFNQFQSILDTRYQDIIYQLFNDEILVYDTPPISYGNGFGHNSCIIGNIMSIDHIMKYENHFISPSGGVIGIYLLNEKLKSDIQVSGKVSNQFNLVLRELFSKKFKKTNTDLPDFLIVTKHLIDVAINFGCIGFLKYYYENGDGSSGNDEDVRLLQQYLKEQLLLHYNFKYLNWLK